MPERRQDQNARKNIVPRIPERRWGPGIARKETGDPGMPERRRGPGNI